jgi:hypothetical protein
MVLKFNSKGGTSQKMMCDKSWLHYWPMYRLSTLSCSWSQHMSCHVLCLRSHQTLLGVCLAYPMSCQPSPSWFEQQINFSFVYKSRSFLLGNFLHHTVKYFFSLGPVDCRWHISSFNNLTSEDRASWHILIIKSTICTNLSNLYFWNRTLHVSDRFPVHHQESSTVYTAMGICHTAYVDCLLASSQYNLYDIYLLLCIKYWTPDDGQGTCPKHVEFYSKNEFEKLVHLVGFIVRIASTSCT